MTMDPPTSDPVARAPQPEPAQTPGASAADGLCLLILGACKTTAARVVDQVRTRLPAAQVIDHLAQDPPDGEDAPLYPDLIVLVATADCPAENMLIEVADLAALGPVLVVLDGGGDDLGMLAMEAGADDWVALPGFLPEVLIHRVIDRHRAMQQSRDNALQADWEGETNRLGRLASATATVTARSFGSRALRDVLPDLHVTALGRLNDLIDRAIDIRIFGEGKGIESDLQALAESLGFARAGPRDIIDLYVTVLRSRDYKGPAKRRAVMMEESRLIALQLMGHLANYYRMRVIGTPPRRGEKDQTR